MSHWTDHLQPGQPDGPYLSWKQVAPRVGISRTTAWRLQKAGDFPRPYVISAGRVAYREREVEAWRASRAHRIGSGSKPGPRSRAVGSDRKAPPASELAPPTPDAPQPVRTQPPAAPCPAPTRAKPSRRPRRSAGPGEQMTFGF